MFSNLVWLFPQYRAIVQVNQQLVHRIEQLEEQLTRRPAIETVDNLLKSFQEDVLAEQPFPDGKIPESMWLTGSSPKDDPRGG